MKNKPISYDLLKLVAMLHQQQVIAYPTEAVFGLGCDPDSEDAVRKIFKIKKRSLKKGLILIANNYTQLMKYVDDSLITSAIKKQMFAHWPGFITWILPARSTTPFWLTGKRKSIAVRIVAFEPVKRLCNTFGKALVSTSANLAGLSPARTANEVRKKLGINFPILDEKVGGYNNPSEIRDALSGKLIRRG